MEKPNILNERIDNQSNCLIQVFAFRKLTEDEIIRSARRYMKENKLSKLPHNGRIQIYTLYGLDPSDEI